jgi:GNAT superfamily N-acetyltransferase
MSNSITFRLAVPADAPDMAEVHMRSWEAAYKNIISEEYIKEKNATRPALWKRIVTDENQYQCVILENGKTVGIMCVVPKPQEDDLSGEFAELEDIYLHPDYYRQGIGTQAMEFAYEKARSWVKLKYPYGLLLKISTQLNFMKNAVLPLTERQKPTTWVRLWRVSG